MVTYLNTLGGLQLFRKCLQQSIEMMTVPSLGISTSLYNQSRYRNNIPKKRHPEWLPRPTRVLVDEQLTTENKEFIKEVIESKYGPTNVALGIHVSPMKEQPIEPVIDWTPGTRRTGLIAKKIGVYPMWLKNGKKVSSTLLQIVDNHVIKYIPPEDYNPVKRTKHIHPKRKSGCLVVGAESSDPQMVTKEYFSLFAESGVMPKRVIMRFVVSPQAALQPGTPLYAAHFKPGDVLDIRAKTVDRGFQGVMKRWGFHGMPASHGVTKTHRRPGNIGQGGKIARVRPGTKLPGHMGNRWRVHRGIRVLRVNTKYNVIWILGQNLPGEINTYCYLYDTLLRRRRAETPPYLPTYLPNVHTEQLPENMYADEVHPFGDPTIEFAEEA